MSIGSLLSYDGMERAVVRSMALFFLGAKALILELMPPAATKWFPGFSNSGNRLKGLEMLRTCVREDAMFARQQCSTSTTLLVGLYKV